MRFPEFIDCPLSIDDKAELNYLIHDKAHISEGGIIVPLENAMKIHSKPMDTFLYRGVSQLEYDAIMSGKDLNMYQSFSEDIEIARRFGPIVIRLDFQCGCAFPLWKWGICGLEKLKEENSIEYEKSDGDYLIEAYEEEKEWIIPYNSKLSPLDNRSFYFNGDQQMTALFCAVKTSRQNIIDFIKDKSNSLDERYNMFKEYVDFLPMR